MQCRAYRGTNFEHFDISSQLDISLRVSTLHSLFKSIIFQVVVLGTRAKEDPRILHLEVDVVGRWKLAAFYYKIIPFNDYSCGPAAKLSLASPPIKSKNYNKN